MISSRRIVFLCFYPAYPPTNGSGAVTYGLAKHVDAQAHIVQVARVGSDIVTPDGVSVETVPMASGSRWRKLLGLRRRVRQMASACSRYAPDVIMLEGASWTLYHWRLLAALRRSCPGVPIVYHSHFVEYPWRRGQGSWAIAAATKHAEACLVEDADHVFAVSKSDAAAFHRLYGVKPGLLPNAADVERFECVPTGAVDAIRRQYKMRAPAVLFMGLADYAPNREGIDFLVNHAFPALLHRREGVQLVLIGGEVAHRRDWLLAPGRIPYEDVPAMVRAADICVAPVFSGTGTRLKILEYMATGRPVVSTSKGAEGLDITSGRDILIADDAAGFAESMDSLLADPETAARIGARGAALVREKYSWSALAGELSGAMDRWIGVRAAEA